MSIRTAITAASGTLLTNDATVQSSTLGNITAETNDQNNDDAAALTVPQPPPDLAFTGATILWSVATGIMLLAIGASSSLSDVDAGEELV